MTMAAWTPQSIPLSAPAADRIRFAARGVS